MQYYTQTRILKHVAEKVKHFKILVKCFSTRV